MLARLTSLDRPFMASVSALIALGVVMVFSASGVMAEESYGDVLFYLKRHLTMVVLGIALMVVLSQVHYRHFLRFSRLAFFLGIGALLLVEIPGLGREVNGARRWVQLLGFGFQPSEFVKVALIVFLVGSLGRRQDVIRSFSKGVVPTGLALLLVAALLMRQPDFGNAAIVMLLGFVSLFLAGARIMHLLIPAVLAMGAGVLAVLAAPYRLRRVTAFLNPWQDPRDTSYQIVQSFSAFFSGGVSGKGIGNSQEKLFFLPEAHTDFIFAVIGEELGFIGVCGLILAFVVLAWRGFQIARSSQDGDGFLLAGISTALLSVQALLNLAVVTGLLPTKGLPLPLISHGGSALLASFFLLGFILSVARHSHTRRGPGVGDAGGAD